jgi:hypothetical protein
VGLSTDSEERLRVFATGGVSIGNTTDPGATNLSITGTGKFGTTIGVGAATPAASGAGVTFPAAQSASTNPNTLDDYEEGNWTPGSSGITTNSGTPVYAGVYTKIGRQVTVKWSMSGGSVTTVAGTSKITGLPYAPVDYFVGNFFNELPPYTSGIMENNTTSEIVLYAAITASYLCGSITYFTAT